MAGYSQTPFAKKLGVKNTSKVMLVNAPYHYLQLFTDMPADVYFVTDETVAKDIIHFFTKQHAEFLATLPPLMKQIKADDAIWVFWPKKASKVVADINEDLIRGF